MTAWTRCVAGSGARLASMALIVVCAASAYVQDSPWMKVLIPEEGQGNYEALHFITANEGWVLSRREDGGRLRLDTFDGGKTWDVRPIDEDAYRALLRARFADPLNGWAHADLNADLWLDRVDGHNPGEDNGILAPVVFHQTSDGGRSWTLREGEITDVAYFGAVAKAREADRKYTSATHFVNSRFGVIAGAAGVARRRGNETFTVFRGHTLLVTRDGGTTWSMHVFGGALPDDRFDPTWGPPPPIASIAFVGEQHGRIPASDGELPRFLRTDDGGRTWEAVTGNPRNGVAPTFGDNVYFRTPAQGWSWGRIRGMSRTEDGGSTWASMEPLRGRSPTFVDDNEGWLHSEVSESVGGSTVIPALRGVYHTVDGGTTWNLEFAGTRVGEPFLTCQLPTWAVWMYGRLGVYVRPLTVPAGVHPSGRLLTKWAATKREH